MARFIRLVAILAFVLPQCLAEFNLISFIQNANRQTQSPPPKSSLHLNFGQKPVGNQDRSAIRPPVQNPYSYLNGLLNKRPLYSNRAQSTQAPATTTSTPNQNRQFQQNALYNFIYRGRALYDRPPNRGRSLDNAGGTTPHPASLQFQGPNSNNQIGNVGTFSETGQFPVEDSSTVQPNNVASETTTVEVIPETTESVDSFENITEIEPTVNNKPFHNISDTWFEHHLNDTQHENGTDDHEKPDDLNSEEETTDFDSNSTDVDLTSQAARSNPTNRNFDFEPVLITDDNDSDKKENQTNGRAHGVVDTVTESKAVPVSSVDTASQDPQGNSRLNGNIRANDVAPEDRFQLSSPDTFDFKGLSCNIPRLFAPCDYYKNCFQEVHSACTARSYFLGDDVSKLCPVIDLIKSRNQQLSAYLQSVQRCINDDLRTVLEYPTCDDVTRVLTTSLLTQSETSCLYQSGAFCDVIRDEEASKGLTELFDGLSRNDTFKTGLLANLGELSSYCAESVRSEFLSTLMTYVTTED